MSRPRKSLAFWVLGLAAAATAVAGVGLLARAPRGAIGGGVARAAAVQALGPDAFEGGVAWINSGPITLKELRGKIVILDFWTLCCINCHHVLPVLNRIEEKYKNEVVVIGVHSPKFTGEQDTETIRLKVREYGVKHPVVNDANQAIWNHFGVNSWPTLMVIGPQGQPLAKQGGEVTFEVMDQFIGKAVAEFKADLKLTPVKFFPESEKPDTTPLLFPGKVLADAAGRRLFVSDTGHNRVVVTDLDGKSPVVIGTGKAGLTDGAFDKAELNRPQGLCLVDETLYVADTENHALRAVDLKAKTVTTIAGTGQQAHFGAKGSHTAPASKQVLTSPWDVAHVAGTRVLYVAMAGSHQIWRYDLEANTISLWAGTGRENVTDGSIGSATFAQPSGLASDGHHLFVADSEGSSVRSIVLGPKGGRVSTLLGEHDLPHGQTLFTFGDVDGPGNEARLQHCLGVAWADGHLYVADTYNNKVKAYDSKTRVVRTFAGTGEKGSKDRPAEFYQPGGLSVAGNRLYVADTNNHKIRVVSLEPEKNAVTTLALADLGPPKVKARRPTFPNAVVVDAPKAEAAAGKSVAVDVTLPVPAGYKLSDQGLMPVLVETPGKPDALSADYPTAGRRIDQAKHFTVEVPLARAAADGDKLDLKVSVMALVCSEGSSLCMIKSFVWNVPVTFKSGGPDSVAVGARGE